FGRRQPQAPAVHDPLQQSTGPAHVAPPARQHAGVEPKGTAAHVAPLSTQQPATPQSCPAGTHAPSRTDPAPVMS
ncbi:MAG TPA: hypothetical protein VMS22_22830, partial [Candidatus Eisenbacteria bacterium]|nr:hypothetical protein [Candidatus Eisenbacteria bacterium]